MTKNRRGPRGDKTWRENAGNGDMLFSKASRVLHWVFRLLNCEYTRIAPSWLASEIQRHKAKHRSYISLQPLLATFPLFMPYDSAELPYRCQTKIDCTNGASTDSGGLLHALYAWRATSSFPVSSTLFFAPSACHGIPKAGCPYVERAVPIKPSVKPSALAPSRTWSQS